jgi:hypothetical protein
VQRQSVATWATTQVEDNRVLASNAFAPTSRSKALYGQTLVRLARHFTRSCPRARRCNAGMRQHASSAVSLTSPAHFWRLTVAFAKVCCPVK